MKNFAEDFNNPLNIARHICASLRSKIVEVLDSPTAGDVAGIASSGDTTYNIDVIAENILKTAAETTHAPVAVYSEDQGLISYCDKPKWLLIVDPIDGTRPAAAGLNTCCVSVAAARLTDEPRMSDVVAGAVYELRRDFLYYAALGEKATGVFNGIPNTLRVKPPEHLCDLRWSLETVARPAKENFTAARYLIDETSLQGGFFIYSSSAFTLCQIASGRFSGMVDLSGRLLKDFDPSGEKARQVGQGRVMGLWAYDIAAAALIAVQAGAVVTDAWGNSLDDVRLTQTRPEDMASCICAASPELHSKMLNLIDRGFDDIELNAVY